MKKYMTPELSELFVLEDVLADSDLDNIGGDPAGDDDYDKEDGWSSTGGANATSIIAD